MLHPAFHRLHPSRCCGFAVAGVFSLRLERQLIKQLNYNLLFR